MSLLKDVKTRTVVKWRHNWSNI